MRRRSFTQEVATSERRKQIARKERLRTVWLGFGMFGLIGWSVVVPTLAGALLGAWLDRTYPSAHSRTLALMVAGLTLGCWNAWRLVAAEGAKMRQAKGDDND